jgi:colicin import membrane protein
MVARTRDSSQRRAPKRSIEDEDVGSDVAKRCRQSTPVRKARGSAQAGAAHAAGETAPAATGNSEDEPAAEIAMAGSVPLSYRIRAGKKQYKQKVTALEKAALQAAKVAGREAAAQLREAEKRARVERDAAKRAEKRAEKAAAKAAAKAAEQAESQRRREAERAERERAKEQAKEERAALRELDKQNAANAREFESVACTMPPSDLAGITETDWGFYGLCVAPAIETLLEEDDAIGAALLPLSAQPLLGAWRSCLG